MDERLEQLASKGLGEKTVDAQLLELGPRLDAAIEVVDHEAEEDQPEVALEHRGGGRQEAAGREPAQKRQAIGEADREEELRHDRVGVAAIRVVVLEDRRHHLVAAQEVDEEHADDGVAAKLVERDDTSRAGLDRLIRLSAIVPIDSDSREGRDDRPEKAERAGQPVEVALGPGDRLDGLGARQRARRRIASRPVRPGGRRPPATRAAGRGNRPATCDRRSASRRSGDGARSTSVIDGVVADHGGQDVRQRQDPRPDRTRLPAKPARRERQDRVLDVGGDDARGQPLGQLDRIIEPHHQVAGIERHAGDVGVEPVEDRDQLVAGQIGVGLDRQPYSQVLEARSEPLDDVDRRLDLAGPGSVGPEAVVAIADVNPGMAASERATAST